MKQQAQLIGIKKKVDINGWEIRLDLSMRFTDKELRQGPSLKAFLGRLSQALADMKPVTLEVPE